MNKEQKEEEQKKQPSYLQKKISWAAQSGGLGSGSKKSEKSTQRKPENVPDLNIEKIKFRNMYSDAKFYSSNNTKSGDEHQNSSGQRPPLHSMFTIRTD